MDITLFSWALLALAALLTGLSKTAVPGINTVAVALAAALLPAKASTGLILLLFMVGDVFALAMYRKHAHWPTLLGMIPAVLTGLLAGVAFLAQATDNGVKQLIGVILLLALGNHRVAETNPAETGQGHFVCSFPHPYCRLWLPGRFHDDGG